MCRRSIGAKIMVLDYTIPSPAYRALLTMHLIAHTADQAVDLRVPAMLGNLHIRLSGQTTYVLPDGRRVCAPPVSLIGSTNSAYRIELSADAVVVGTGFLPLGWLTLIRCPAVSLSDDVIDGADLWGAQRCAEACERLREAPLGGHGTILEALLSCPQRTSSRLDHLQAVDRWLECGPDLSVETLREELGIGRRQLQRVTLDLYGATPKVLAMKYRALRAAAQLATFEGATIRDVLTLYADQPHLNRDFRRFIGVSPGAFLQGQAKVTATTMIGRRRAGAIRPLALWS